MSDEQVEMAGVEDLHAWLTDHHASSDGAWLVRWKKGRGPYVANEDLVCALLVHGWIDGQARGVDDDTWVMRITPRRPGSGWSRVNKERVARLVAEGRMLPAGAAAVERARADGSWSALDEVELLLEPDDLRTALDAVPAARVAWEAFPPSARKVLLTWVGSARTTATRERRVTAVVSEAAQGRRANQPDRSR